MIKLIELEKQLKKVSKNSDLDSLKEMRQLIIQRNKRLNKIFKDFHFVAEVFVNEYCLDLTTNVGIHKNNLIVCSLPIQFVLDPRQYTFKYNYNKSINRDVFTYTFRSVNRNKNKLSIQFCCIETDKYIEEHQIKIEKLKDRLCELLEKGGND